MYIKEVLDMYHPAEATLAGSEKPENCLRTVMDRQELNYSWNLLHWQSAPIETGKDLIQFKRV